MYGRFRGDEVYLAVSFERIAVLRSFLIFDSNGGGASDSVDAQRRLRSARHCGQSCGRLDMNGDGEIRMLI